jgi:hypothetical protein
MFGRGSYLVNAVAVCNSCHTNPSRTSDTMTIHTNAYLSGGRTFTVPPTVAPTLHQARTMASGFAMPWATFRNILRDDLEAVYTYLSNVPVRTGANDKATQPVARWCAADGDCRAAETCALATHECVGRICSGDADCGACQTCNAKSCAAPAPDSPCLTAGL